MGSWSAPTKLSSGVYGYSTPGHGNSMTNWSAAGTSITVPVPQSDTAPFGGSGYILGHWVVRFNWVGSDSPPANQWYLDFDLTNGVDIIEASYTMNQPNHNVMGSTDSTEITPSLATTYTAGSTVTTVNGVHSVTFTVGVGVQTQSVSPDELFKSVLTASYDLASSAPYHS